MQSLDANCVLVLNSLDDVIISFFVTGPGSTTLPLKILSMVKTGVTPEVNALSTIIMFVIMIGISVKAGIQVKQLKKDHA